MSLAAAIKSRWEAAGLASVIPGGLWQEKAPTGVAWPYQVFLVIGQTFNGRTSTTHRRRLAFEIHTYYKPVSGKDPEAELDAILDSTEAAFEDQVLTPSNLTAMVVTQNDRRTFEEDFQVYRGLNEFDCRFQKSR